jgi:hypothetical protein
VRITAYLKVICWNFRIDTDENPPGQPAKIWSRYLSTTCPELHVCLVTVQELQHIYTTLEICFLKYITILIQIPPVPLVMDFEINVQTTPIILVLHVLSNVSTRGLQQIRISVQYRKFDKALSYTAWINKLMDQTRENIWEQSCWL